MSSDTYPRAEVQTKSKGRIRSTLDTLQEALSQKVETVTRPASFQTVGGNVEDIDPPEDIDELYALYEEIGLIRANLNQFVSDVWKPGARVVADDDTTEAYFNGGEDIPDFAPEGGFINNCFVFDEKSQPFQYGGKTTTLNRWVRGTVTLERLKKDDEDPESEITGWRHIRPETLSARTYENTNILVDPEDTGEVPNSEITKRGEAAAYVQFDEQSILGRRNGFRDKTSIPLSQNDVFKQVLDLNIGGDDPEAGVFGTSILRAVKDDAEEYRSIKRDMAESVKSKAWGLWTAQFTPEVIETGDTFEVLRWDQESVDDTVGDIENMGPGDLAYSDAPFDLKRHDGEVPDLDDMLKHYVDDILTPLPAPKYTVGFETDINQFVTEKQDERYTRVIDEEQHYQERQWSKEFQLVAERHPQLDPSGVKLEVQPDDEESPVLSLDDADVERIATFSKAMKDLFGPGGAPTYVDEEILLQMVLQLPEESLVGGEMDGLSLDELGDMVED